MYELGFTSSISDILSAGSAAYNAREERKRQEALAKAAGAQAAADAARARASIEAEQIRAGGTVARARQIGNTVAMVAGIALVGLLVVKFRKKR